MSTFFVDTSALAKRYLSETGSRWTLTWILPTAGNVIVLAELTVIEMTSLLARHVRDGALTTANAHTLEANVLLHAAQEYLIMPQGKTVLNLARQLLFQHPLRTLDAVQLASALHAQNSLGQSLTFVSGDTRLLAAAAAAGLVTDDPNAHP